MMTQKDRQDWWSQYEINLSPGKGGQGTNTAVVKGCSNRI